MGSAATWAAKARVANAEMDLRSIVESWIVSCIEVDQSGGRIVILSIEVKSRTGKIW